MPKFDLPSTVQEMTRSTVYRLFGAGHLPHPGRWFVRDSGEGEHVTVTDDPTEAKS